MTHRGLNFLLRRVLKTRERQAHLVRARPSTDSPYFAPETPGSAKIASWSGISRS
jgi:hypothetical protein